MFNQHFKCTSEMGFEDSGCSHEWPKPKKSKTETNTGWNCAPALILDNVFQYLSFKDAINASSTCQNWRPILFHPRSWQNVTFVIDNNTLPQATYLRTMVGHIVSNATVKFNSTSPNCVREFLLLIEYFMENNNLQSLVLEPNYCHVLVDEDMFTKSNSLVDTLINLYSQRPYTKFSVGCTEELLNCIPEVLKSLANFKAENVTMLGLASVKEDPNHYLIDRYNPELLKPFQRLQILSIDYDNLNDELLDLLQNTNDLKRLVVHIHGIVEDHPGTSEEAWNVFRAKQPNCTLRLSLIHAIDEVCYLDNLILRINMPLSHLKVLFCEGMNKLALEKLVHYRDTLKSIVWVDSLGNAEENTLLKSSRMGQPSDLILIAWLCQSLEEIVMIGYRYYEDDWIGIVKLRSNTLKKLEIAEADVVRSGCDNLKEVLKNSGSGWSTLKHSDLHPVFLDAENINTDEYLMPLVLSDLH